MHRKITEEMVRFIQSSPSPFHCVNTISNLLRENGFQRLYESEKWELEKAKKYFVIRNDSSIIAFKTGDFVDDFGFQITTSHTDSPCFKVKANAELEVQSKYVKLNTEGYGGMILSSWLDRPLSVAGRVMVLNGDLIESKLVNIDRDLLLIPNVAIHMNRTVNEGMAYNKQVDMLPVFCGASSEKRDLKEVISSEIGVDTSDILDMELFVYNRSQSAIWGADQEFVSSPKLDDLQCVYSSLQGFLAGDNEKSVNVFACFDNEEVGSGTKQGAASTFLADTLLRICVSMGKTQEDYMEAIARSFMLSCDNAHAVHPNHPEKTDAKNCVYMNEGVVIKYHAGQKYTSDAASASVFRTICNRAGVPVQYFANRSDMASGSTLGNIAMSQVSLHAVDIGLAQLAMHSSYETAGVLDTEYMMRATKAFYDSKIRIKCGNKFEIV